MWTKIFHIHKNQN